MASLQKRNRLHCCGRWSAATPPLVEAAGTGDWSVVRGGAGIWTATMNVPIDILERCVFVTTRVISTQAAVVAGGSDTTFVVNVLSDAAAATDAAIDFLVIRTGG